MGPGARNGSSVRLLLRCRQLTVQILYRYNYGTRDVYVCAHA